MKILRVPLVLLALLLATSLPTGVQAAKMPNRPTALAVETIDDQTSVLIWSGSAGTFRARAIKLNRRGAIRPSTSRTCTAELSQAGPGRCAVARLSPGRWQIRVTHVTSGGVAIRTKTIVVPLMSGFPTGFAPCAGNAETVKQAAYNCLRDWKPQRGEYQGEVVYHFSPSLSPSRQAQIKEVTMFTLSRTEGFVEYMGFSPEFHLFFNIDGKEECKRMFQSWEGTKNKTWIWDREGSLCTSDSYGGQSVGSDIRKTNSAGVNIQGDGIDWWIYHGMPHEILVSFFGVGSESVTGNQWRSLEIGQLWVHYLASRAAWQASGIQLLGESLDQYQNGLLPGPGKASWQPSVADPRFCPQPGSDMAMRCGKFDWGGLMAEEPNNYALIDLASQYVTAKFGPEWVQRQLWPTEIRYLWPVMKQSYVDGSGDFRPAIDRVAYELWGGKWSDLETAIDEYAVSEWRKHGWTGLE